jgi:hypothetical protein
MAYVILSEAKDLVRPAHQILALPPSLPRAHTVPFAFRPMTSPRA